MRSTPAVLLEVLRARLWVIPSLAALVAAFAALSLVWLDEAVDPLGTALAISPDSARALLSTVSGAMISFTALVFSITMLVLQSASTQLSPRVVRTFLRDRFNQLVLGLFVATFVFALLVLAAVSDEDVPQLSSISAVGLVLVAVLAFVAYIDHMAHAIRPASVIESIADEARAVIEEVYPDSVEHASQAQAEATAGVADRPGITTMAWQGQAGYVQSVDRDRSLELAEAAGGDVELLVTSGSFLVRGQPVLRVPRSEDLAADAQPAPDELVRVGPERTMSEDPAFGLRLLVDVGLRALSPSLNDPSTANAAIDRLHELLALLQSRDIPSPIELRAASGSRVMLPAPTWDDYVELAATELGQACRSVPQVRRHLLRTLDALLEIAPGPRLPALRRARAAIEPGPGTAAPR